MRNAFLSPLACLFIFFSIDGKINGQTAPEFLDCHSEIVSLCVNDEGVRLPSNNQIYLGEENPVASSCSVHVSQKKKVQVNCGSTLQYEVNLVIDDTVMHVLAHSTQVEVDSSSEAVINFDSEFAPDSIIRNNGIPYNTSCNNTYKIQWIVSDSCGHIAICENDIYSYDCTPPISSDSNQVYTVIIGAWGIAHLYAKNYIGHVVDDCADSSHLLFSFSENYYLPDTLIDPCDYGFGIEIETEIWIADAGWDVDCNDTIEWNERNITKVTPYLVYVDHFGVHCDYIMDLYLSGTISTEDERTVEQVAVTLISPGHVFPTYVTVENGIYSFNNIFSPFDYLIECERNDNHKNGVSTLDLVKIQKHLLGKEYLNTPYKIIAADANNSQSVSAIDLVELRKLVLGIYTVLPNNESWRFVPKDFIFLDTLYPWPFDEEALGMIVDNTFRDFIGIKVGDVNNTVQTNANSILPRTNYKQVAVSVPQKSYATGEEIIIPLKINADDLLGFQFTLSSTDLEFFGASSTAVDFSEDNYALFDDKMTFSWFDADEVKLNSDQIELEIHARAKKSGNLKNMQINSGITEPEVYDKKGNIFTPQLQINEVLEGATVYPNPWKEETNISFQLEKNGNVLLEIFDLDGKVIYQHEKIYPKGGVNIKVNSQQVTGNWLYIYSIKTTEFNYSGKMSIGG